MAMCHGGDFMPSKAKSAWSPAPMILSGNSSWMYNELTGIVPSVVRYCYVQDIISMHAGRFIVSDGLHFVASIIPKQSLSQLVEGYSLKSLQLKGSVLLVDKCFFYATRSRVEMMMEDCIYFGEGSLSSRTRDIGRNLPNRIVKALQRAGDAKPLCRSTVLRFLDHKALLDKSVHWQSCSCSTSLSRETEGKK